MRAASYVGRVGGLAIALGVGTAIITGQGVAYADDTDASTSPPSQSAQTSQSNTGKQPLGKHRSTERTSLADTVKGITDRVAEERQKRADARAEAADESDATPRRGGDRRKARTETSTQQQDSATSEEAPAAEPTPAAAEQPRVLSWLQTPRAVAGRQQADEPRVQTTLWTPPVRAVDEAPARTVVTGLLSALDRTLSPASSGSGSTPVGGSLSDLLLLAGARRQSALDIDPYSIRVTQGVISGCVVGTACTTADGSTYTVIDRPSNGGKLTLDATTGAFRFLPYADENATNGPTGTETFSVLVAQNTKFTTVITGLPIVGSSLITPVVQRLQQAGVLSGLLGTAELQDISVDITGLRAGQPIAFTTFVTSWDGTKISTNFFPALAGSPDLGKPGYETIFNGPGLAQPGATDPADPFVSTFRSLGYNVVTWDPRGEFASGGRLQLDSPQYEGQDVSELISWVSTQSGVQLDKAGDPTMGMVGVSYGGGIQFVTAASDDRVDAIAPGWAWNTLPDSLYPHSAFRTSYAGLLLLGLVETGARINPQIYGGILTGASLGILTPSQIQLLQNSGPGQTVRNIDIPTLIIQGTVDVLFPLQQSILNMGYMANNPNVKLIWYCGGHGTCLPGQGNGDADEVWFLTETAEWMQRYVKDLPIPADPYAFEWTDQNSDRWASETRPTADDFYDADSKVPPTVWDTGKTLPIIPFIGGSGPQPEIPLPYGLGAGSVATNAVTIPISNPGGEANVVGAPHVVINYSGLGSSRHIYAQVVDKSTGLVVGNIVSPVPVTLNGRDQVAEIDLEDIAYTMTPDSDLELQIFTTATPFLNLTQFGFVHIDSVEVTLPTTSAGVNMGPNLLPA
ncbi:peptidase S15 [Mycolicibacterium sp. 018/SC-01/001]|uniref:alpha/beta hydrolase family protein n=1 Tax=Mycolicibacterium sp. 018/SC-01/001 TaxID=2592069 RepID=UPI00117EC99D|nr:CocE/NonD family hydrolase [Mycolicibacterium sp. 018/SC-01/001]TRW88485.1 peptidase S15 [Mycolicibacterium sp. 018/SC-01/001]